MAQIPLDGGVALYDAKGVLHICKRVSSKTGKSTWKSCPEHKHLTDKRPSSVYQRDAMIGKTNGGEPMYPSAGYVSVDDYNNWDDDPYRKYGA